MRKFPPARRMKCLRQSMPQTVRSLHGHRCPCPSERSCCSIGEIVLMEHLEELTLLCARELGKTLNEARGDVLKAIEPTELACATPYLTQGAPPYR